MVVPKLVPSVELVNSIVIEVGNKWIKKYLYNYFS